MVSFLKAFYPVPCVELTRKFYLKQHLLSFYLFHILFQVSLGQVSDFSFKLPFSEAIIILLIKYRYKEK
jgi:hypothetical protein